MQRVWPGGQEAQFRDVVVFAQTRRSKPVASGGRFGAIAIDPITC